VLLLLLLGVTTRDAMRDAFFCFVCVLCVLCEPRGMI